MKLCAASMSAALQRFAKRQGSFVGMPTMQFMPHSPVSNVTGFADCAANGAELVTGAEADTVGVVAVGGMGGTEITGLTECLSAGKPAAIIV